MIVPILDCFDGIKKVIFVVCLLLCAAGALPGLACHILVRVNPSKSVLCFDGVWRGALSP